MNKFIHISTTAGEYFINIDFIVSIEQSKKTNSYWINTKTQCIEINSIQFRFLRNNIFRLNEINLCIDSTIGISSFLKIKDMSFDSYELKQILTSKWHFVSELLYVNDDEFLDTALSNDDEKLLIELKRVLWDDYSIKLGELA